MALEKNQAKTKQHVKYTKYKMCLSMVMIICIKGCVRYILASLFFKSKREHLSN